MYTTCTTHIWYEKISLLLRATHFLATNGFMQNLFLVKLTLGTKMRTRKSGRNQFFFFCGIANTNEIDSGMQHFTMLFLHSLFFTAAYYYLLNIYVKSCTSYIQYDTISLLALILQQQMIFCKTHSWAR